MQIHHLRIHIDLARFLLVGRKVFGRLRNSFWRSRIFLPVKNFFTGRELFLSVENFLQVEKFLADREFFLVVENFFCLSRGWTKIFCGKLAFSRENVSCGINNMASSDGNSAGNMLRQILGRIGDLCAAIDQRQAYTDSQCSLCGCIALSKPSNYSFALTSMSFRDLPLCKI